uniref:ANK_REP_REGION domain-containing protein n=2 Tax=Mesocestoides corti TaxID=53468 RepID=A0A5K3EYN0_MESCO
NKQDTDCKNVETTLETSKLHLCTEVKRTLLYKIVAFPSDETFAGTHLGSVRHGFGIWNTSFGSFAGTFWEDAQDGFGITVSSFSPDKLYMGFFRENARFGIGISLQDTHKIDVGIWNMNRLVELPLALTDEMNLYESSIFNKYFQRRLCLPPIKKICSFELKSHENLTVPPVPGVEFEVFKANPYLYDLYEKGYFEIFENAMDSDSVPDDEKIAVTFYLAQHTNFLSNTGFSVESLKDVLKSLNATHAANCGGWITSTVNTLFSAAQNNDTFGVSDVLTNSLVEANMLEGSEEYPIMVDVNLADLRGVTPLHVASANLSYDVVKLLLSYGANTNALTVDGISCLSFCVCTYVDRHPVQIGSDSHLIELNRDEITTEKWFRAEISWLLGSDNDIHEEILEVEEKHNPEEENYTETGFMSLLRDFCRPGYSLATIASTFNKYMSPNEFLDALIKEKVPKFARQTKLRKIGGQHRKCLVTKATQIDPEDLKYLRKSIRVSRRLETVLTLLQYGADPNASSVPMTPLIAASRPADLELTRLLLHFGADPNVRIQARPDTAAEMRYTDFKGNVRELGVIGLTPLHFAVLTPGEVGVELTRMLLDFGADPNARAEPDDSFLPRSQACDKFGEVFVKSSEVDGGRTALHLACARNYDLKHSAAIVELLMDRGGDPNLLCNGHSPLSVAIASGNDKIVELLVSYQLTNLTMRLTKGLGSALCVVFNPMYENSRNLQCRLTLLSHLIRRCPNGLVNHRIAIPPDNTEGSVVDYAFQVYSSVGPSLLERPFAPVNSTDHQVAKERDATLVFLARKLRESVFASDCWNHNKAGCEFGFCFHCGRSVGVSITPCRRCQSVSFCSNACRRTGWKDWHGKQCLEIIGQFKITACLSLAFFV